MNPMKFILIIFSILIFSFTIISCKSSTSTTTDNSTITELYVSVGYSGTILTSSGGITWTERTSGISNYLYEVTYGNSTFVSVGRNGTILTSPDGITWIKRTSGISENLYGVTYSQ